MSKVVKTKAKSREDIGVGWKTFLMGGVAVIAVLAAASLQPPPTGVSAAQPLLVALNGLQVSTTPDPAFTLDTSQEFVIVSLSVGNNTGAPQNFIPVENSYIEDAAGNHYQMHPTVMLTQPLPGGEVAPYQVLTGQLSYAVPMGLKQARLVVNGVDGAHLADIDLSSQLK